MEGGREGGREGWRDGSIVGLKRDVTPPVVSGNKGTLAINLLRTVLVIKKRKKIQQLCPQFSLDANHVVAQSEPSARTKNAQNKTKEHPAGVKCKKTQMNHYPMFFIFQGFTIRKIRGKLSGRFLRLKYW